MKKQIKLNLGCGVYFVKDFINVDKAFERKQLEEGIKTKDGLFMNAKIDKGAEFVRADMTSLPFKDNYADYIETIDAIEHVEFRKVAEAFSEMYRVLKPKGKLVLATTDFNELARLWHETISGQPFDFQRYINLMEVIYGNQIGGDAESHKTAFNVDFLTILLGYAGFKKEGVKITIYPTGTTSHPPIQTQKWPKNAMMRTSMILVEAIK